VNKPRDLAALARSWVGTPYHHQARGPKGPDGGVDCVGLLIGVAREAGLIGDGYDPHGYAWETDGSQLERELGRWAEPVAQAEARAGDVAVFRVAGCPQHAGFLSLIDYGRGLKTFGLIHAYNPLGEVVEHRLDERWVRRLVALWRLRG
jgi:hypothetical protein